MLLSDDPPTFFNMGALSPCDAVACITVSSTDESRARVLPDVDLSGAFLELLPISGGIRRPRFS